MKHDSLQHISGASADDGEMPVRFGFQREQRIFFNLDLSIQFRSVRSAKLALICGFGKFFIAENELLWHEQSYSIRPHLVVI